MDVCRIWEMCKGPEGNMQHFPDEGGAADQSSLLVDFFNILNGAEFDFAKLKASR
jgi:hypothetical protein